MIVAAAGVIASGEPGRDIPTRAAFDGSCIVGLLLSVTPKIHSGIAASAEGEQL